MVSSVVTSAAVVLRLRCGSFPATIPLAESQTYQSPVESVRLIRMNLAPPVKPQLIVCDEPTSALDVSVQAQILNLLRELQDSLGVSYLFVTHNIGVVAYLADRVAVMHSGKIVEMGDASQILNDPQDSYTKTLLSAVPKLNQALA